MKTKYIYLMLCKGHRVPNHARHPDIPEYVYGNLLAPSLKEEEIFFSENPDLDPIYFLKIGTILSFFYENYSINNKAEKELIGEDLEFYNQKLDTLDLNIKE